MIDYIKKINTKRFWILASSIWIVTIILLNQADIKKDYRGANYDYNQLQESERKSVLEKCLFEKGTSTNSLKEKYGTECTISAADNAGGGVAGFVGFGSFYNYCLYSKTPDCLKYATSKHHRLNMGWYFNSSYSDSLKNTFFLLLSFPLLLALGPAILRKTFNWLTEEKKNNA